MFSKLLLSAVALSSSLAYALTCGSGENLCAFSDGTNQFCYPNTYSCPPGTVLVNESPLSCDGFVYCTHLNDWRIFTYPGQYCPAGSAQLGLLQPPTCPDNKINCVNLPAMNGCYTYWCPAGMFRDGASADCSIPPQTCTTGKSLYVQDNAAVFQCLATGSVSPPGFHLWTGCTYGLDLPGKRIRLGGGDYIKCINGLTRDANGNLKCSGSVFNSELASTNPAMGQFLYLADCSNADNSARYLKTIAQGLGFTSYTASSVSASNLVSSYSSSYREYCYVNNKLVFWMDPLCGMPADARNTQCVVNEFILIK